MMMTVRPSVHFSDVMISLLPRLHMVAPTRDSALLPLYWQGLLSITLNLMLVSLSFLNADVNEQRQCGIAFQ